MVDHAQCSAMLQGDVRCRSVVVKGSEFCAHHDRLVEQHGTGALKRGEHLPPRRSERKPRIVSERLIVDEFEPVVGNGMTKPDPASVRPRLRKRRPRAWTISCGRFSMLRLGPCVSTG
jgi:hypothetical protein